MASPTFGGSAAHSRGIAKPLVPVVAVLPPAFAGWRIALALDSNLLGLMAAALLIVIGCALVSVVEPRRSSNY
jgi:hypothetical protein